MNEPSEWNEWLEKCRNPAVPTELTDRIMQSVSNYPNLPSSNRELSVRNNDLTWAATIAVCLLLGIVKLWAGLAWAVAPVPVEVVVDNLR